MDIIKEEKENKLYQTGWELMREGTYLQSIKAFDKAIHKNTECGDAYFGRAICHYKTGCYHKSAYDMKAAAVLGCEDAVFWSK